MNGLDSKGQFVKELRDLAKRIEDGDAIDGVIVSYVEREVGGVMCITGRYFDEMDVMRLAMIDEEVAQALSAEGANPFGGLLPPGVLWRSRAEGEG